MPRYGETKVLAVLSMELLWRHGNRVDEQVSSWQLQVHDFLFSVGWVEPGHSVRCHIRYLIGEVQR